MSEEIQKVDILIDRLQMHRALVLALAQLEGFHEIRKNDESAMLPITAGDPNCPVAVATISASDIIRLVREAARSSGRALGIHGIYV